MMWLFEIFSEKADQARLITILLSATVAVLIVLLNQWFISRRSKRELLIEKIEELYLASSHYIKVCTNILNSIAKHKNSEGNKDFNLSEELSIEITEAINRIEMICGLYFEEEKINSEDFYIHNMPIVDIVTKKKQIAEDVSWAAHEKSREHILVSREKLSNLCNKLMKKYGH